MGSAEGTPRRTAGEGEDQDGFRDGEVKSGLRVGPLVREGMPRGMGKAR